VKSSPGEISRLLLNWREGGDAATSKLMRVVYSELRRLAARQMRRERPDHTLQTTGLVNEAYLRLVSQKNAPWEGRIHFFGVASRVMREILVEYARKRAALKRGGARKVYLEDVAEPAALNKGVDLLALDEALLRLERLDPQQCRIVELRFFSGLSVEETAAVLGISPRTVKRDWSVAKIWLHREIRTL
jgi:RNA polymerase sigma factor (TIGR02999 family)